MKENGRQRRNVILLTGEFPFGSGETFIENEIPFLTRGFQKVFILVPADVTNKPQRSTPRNVTIIPIKPGRQWVYRINTLLRFSFWKGLQMDLRRENRQTGFLNVFRNGWHYYTHALLVKKAIHNVMIQNKLKFRVTILYSYWFDEKALGVALVKEKIPGIKAVSRAHGWDVFEERHHPPFLPFRPWLLKTLDKVAVVSKKGVAYLNDKFEPPEGKMEVSYLGTGPLKEIITPRQGSGQEVNPSVSLKARNEKFTIVSCSSLIPLKRVELIIEALSLLDFPVSWTHIGDGPLREGMEKKATSLFERKNIEYRFTFQISNKEVREFYETQHVDLFISTSETEGLPVSMMEAQSAGIPILATDVGGVNEIVIDGITGWLLTPDPDEAEVAEKINEIYEIQDAEKQKVRENAIKHWQNNFNAEENYTAFVNLLQNL